MSLNPQKIALITDSCADLNADLIGDDPIFIIPLVLAFQGVEYEDGVTITAQDVYEKTRVEFPRTSLPRSETLFRTFQTIRDQGYERVIAVMLSSGLSGTYNMVRLAAQDVPGLEIFVIDSLTGSLGCGAVLLQLMEYIRRGFEWERLKRIALQLVKNVTVYFSVDTLEFLKKGGRIGKITALAGTVLNLKPIIAFEPDGQLGSVARCRGSHQAQERLMTLAAKARGDAKEYILLTGHGGAPELYPAFRDEVLRRFPDCSRHISAVIDGTLAAYTGPGLLGTGIVILDGIEDC